MLPLISQQKIVEFLNEEFSTIKVQNLQHQTNDLVLVFRTLNHAIDNKFCSNNTGIL